LRLQQLYTQIRIQVINAQYALTNDRAQVQAAQAARDFASQSLDAEQKKYRLGASTTALVLQQQRNLATAENNLISATAAYAKDARRWAAAVEHTGPVRHQHYGCGDGSGGNGSADSGLTLRRSPLAAADCNAAHSAAVAGSGGWIKGAGLRSGHFCVWRGVFAAARHLNLEQVWLEAGKFEALRRV